jgi:hypothetical protein
MIRLADDGANRYRDTKSIQLIEKAYDMPKVTRLPPETVMSWGIWTI